MRIDTSGDVLIGTTDSTTWNGGTSKRILAVANANTGSANSIVTLKSNASTVDHGGIFEGFSTSVTSGSAALGSIGFVRENTSNTALSSMTTFFTNTAGTVSEKMRIDASGNLLVGTSSTTSSVSNVASLVAGKHRSFSGSLSTMTTGVAYTMFTMTADFATYIVTVSGLVSSAAYSETAIVHLNNTSVTVTIIADGSLVTISASGLNIQFTQSSGVTMADMVYSVMRIL